MKTNMVKGQKGFTLIEIAIVLVIIGLLLGGVLQGQQLIQNARVRGMINEINGITAGVTGYQDRYGRLPGDDGPDLATLQARGGNWVGATSPAEFGNMNGTLTGGPAVAALFNGPTAEPLGFWQHLRAAGFISGNPSAIGAAAHPVTPWASNIAVTGVAAFAIPLNVTKLCFNNVPGTAAQAIDTRLDDGANATGRVRAAVAAVVAAGAPAAAAYLEPNVYTMCVSI